MSKRDDTTTVPAGQTATVDGKTVSSDKEIRITRGSGGGTVVESDGDMYIR